jgi:hypothetical protein
MFKSDSVGGAFSAFIMLSAIVLASSRVATSSAAPFFMNYGPHMGTSVTFVDVTESNNEEGALSVPLFGPPIVSGNSMDFNPIGFDATSLGGGGAPDTTAGDLLFMIEAKPGNAIKNIKFSEFGDTTLAGVGTDSTFTAVTMAGSINIHEVDFIGINVISFPFSMSFSPSDGTFQLQTDGSGFKQWMGMVLVDVQQQLVSRPINFVLGATKVSVNLTNVLTAMSETATTAVIAKKDSDFTIEVNIPEPGTAILLALVLAAGAISRGRGAIRR